MRKTPASYATSTAKTPTPRQTDVATMLQLAKQCGFICEAQTEYAAFLATEIASHLVHRRG